MTNPHLHRAPWPALLLVALALAACERQPAWNVLLVTFDTTRADRIGDYGEGNHTPNLDALAAEGVRFANTYTAVPITAPSHSTILTGKYPIAHGFRDNGLFVLGDDQETLAEVLAEAGYATAAAIGAFPLLGRFGLDQGFDLYDDHLTGEWENFLGEKVATKENLFFDERPAAQVNAALLPWLREHADERFFLWAHYFDPHLPYRPKAPYDQLLADDPYRAEIAYADESFGTLVRHLQELGVWDRTLVVFTADHGEGLDEHEESTHSMLLYNGTLRVPLIVRVPGTAGARVVEERVGTVDIMPTILDLLGMEPPAGVQGRTLADAVRGAGEPEPRPLYAETLSPRFSHRWGELRALIADDHKYVFGPRPELFALDRDPFESTDLTGSESERATALQRRLAAFIRDHAVADLPAPTQVDEETRQRLLALGYLGGAGALDEPVIDRLNPEGIPPQDRVIDVSRMSAAKEFLFQGRPEAARALTEKLLEGSPDSPFYRELRAAAELGLGNIEAAARILDEIRDIHPDKRLLARHELRAAQVLLGQRRFGDASAHAAKSLDLLPTAAAQYLSARALKELGRDDEYLDELRATLRLDPGFVVARVDLALALIQAGEAGLGESHLLQAMRDYPFYPRTFFNYGLLALEYGETEEALRNFRRAVELDAGYLKARHALVVALTRVGELESAAAELAELERLAPASDEAREARRAMEESRS